MFSFNQERAVLGSVSCIWEAIWPLVVTGEAFKLIQYMFYMFI